MNNLQKILDSANRKNVREFEKSLTNEITSRIALRLNTEKKKIASGMFKENIDQTEQGQLALFLKDYIKKLGFYKTEIKTNKPDQPENIRTIGDYKIDKKIDINKEIKKIKESIEKLNNNYKVELKFSKLGYYDESEAVVYFNKNVVGVFATSIKFYYYHKNGNITATIFAHDISYNDGITTGTSKMYRNHSESTNPALPANTRVKMNTRGIGGAVGPSATGDGEMGTIISTTTKATPYGTEVVHTIRLNNGQTIQAKDTEFTIVEAFGIDDYGIMPLKVGDHVRVKPNNSINTNEEGEIVDIRDSEWRHGTGTSLQRKYLVRFFDLRDPKTNFNTMMWYSRKYLKKINN